MESCHQRYRLNACNMRPRIILLGFGSATSRLPPPRATGGATDSPHWYRRRLPTRFNQLLGCAGGWIPGSNPYRAGYSDKWSLFVLLRRTTSLIPCLPLKYDWERMKRGVYPQNLLITRSGFTFFRWHTYSQWRLSNAVFSPYTWHYSYTDSDSQRRDGTQRRT